VTDEQGTKAFAAAVKAFLEIEGNTPDQARELLDATVKNLEMLDAAQKAADEAGKQAAKQVLEKMGWQGPIPSKWS
jgi:hypothetical protein